jgi:hypothetical protein
MREWSHGKPCVNIFNGLLLGRAVAANVHIKSDIAYNAFLILKEIKTNTALPFQ